MRSKSLLNSCIIGVSEIMQKESILKEAYKFSSLFKEFILNIYLCIITVILSDYVTDT